MFYLYTYDVTCYTIFSWLDCILEKGNGCNIEEYTNGKTFGFPCIKFFNMRKVKILQAVFLILIEMERAKVLKDTVKVEGKYKQWYLNLKILRFQWENIFINSWNC